MRGVIFILIAGAALWMGLHSCGPVARNTLALKPADSFPADRRQALGRTVARILPYCPGIREAGDTLEFTGLTESEGLTELTFTLSGIPQAQRGEETCRLRVMEQEFELEGRAVCRALCFGETEPEGGVLKKRLGKAE
jgi:hypothetical protein